MKTYIEVDPVMELPTEDGEYLTSAGRLLFKRDGGDRKDTFYRPKKDYWAIVCPSFWLKPIDEQEEAQKRYDEAIRFIDDSNKNGASERVGEHVLNIGIKIAAGLKDKP